MQSDLQTQTKEIMNVNKLVTPNFNSCLFIYLLTEKINRFAAIFKSGPKYSTSSQLGVILLLLIS